MLFSSCSTALPTNLLTHTLADICTVHTHTHTHTHTCKHTHTHWVEDGGQGSFPSYVRGTALKACKQASSTRTSTKTQMRTRAHAHTHTHTQTHTHTHTHRVEDDEQSSFPFNSCGTAAYVAPEALICNRKVTSSVDVYAFGILLWEMYTGQRPYG